MKVVVVGAAGRTGRPLFEQALDAGHEVTAFRRDPSGHHIKHEQLRLVQGDTLDKSPCRLRWRGDGLAPRPGRPSTPPL